MAASGSAPPSSSTTPSFAGSRNASSSLPSTTRPNVKGYRAARELLPEVPQVAVFDTSFHQTMPRMAFLYALPYVLYERHGIRRYGFHGTSHRFVSRRLATLLGRPEDKDLRMITCHLGNGCSVAAVRGRESIDTSMGFTPLEGLVMGTRSGDLDPAILLHVMAKEELAPAELSALLNKHSGLLGLSGHSNDMRSLLEAEAAGQARAGLAVDVFCYRLRKYIASYVGALGGVDAVAFAGGIGENAPPVRRRCSSGPRRAGPRHRRASKQRARAGDRGRPLRGRLPRPRVRGADERGAAHRPGHVRDRLRPGPLVKPQQRTRAIRRGLVALALAVVAAVVLSLRRPPPPAPAPGASPSAAPPGATTAQELVYRRIVDGKEKGVVRAKAMVGQDKEGTRLLGVDATFGHLYEGKEGSTRVVADDCLYDAERQKASFHGNVTVTTTEGLELRSPSLVYNGSKDLLKSDEAVEFNKGNVSGRTLGMDYEAKAGQLGLHQDVFIRIVHEKGPPTEIKSGSATASKVEAMIRFQGDVLITRGEESLKTQRLNLNLSPDLAFVYRAVAIDDMELTTGGGGTNVGSSPLGGDRSRVLRGRKLDAWFDDLSHEIRDAMAGPRASLSIPGPAGGPDRSLTAYMINLKFDAQGRLSELAGVQDAVLVEAPSAKSKQGGGRTVRCATVIARMDPATGSIRDMDFQGGVEIVEPKRRATAHNGHYEEEGPGPLSRRRSPSARRRPGQRPARRRHRAPRQERRRRRPVRTCGTR